MDNMTPESYQFAQERIKELTNKGSLEEYEEIELHALDKACEEYEDYSMLNN